MFKGKKETPLESEITDYLSFLNNTDSSGKSILTIEKVEKNLDAYGHMLNTFLTYPDIFIDLMVPAGNRFSLYPYQRIILRAMARYRETYVAATRAASKSFMAFISKLISTTLLPRHTSFIVADVKSQGANIAREKVVDDIWGKFPLIANEHIKHRVNGKIVDGFTLNQDKAEFKFLHGGKFGVVGNGESIRGARRHSGIVEEVINQDPVALNERIIPMMNVPRKTLKGVLLENEPHAQKIFVTTAGHQGSFAHTKALETLCYAAIDPGKYCSLGMNYEVPVMHGMMDAQQVKEALISPTYGADSFAREYGSLWTGDQNGELFSYALMKKVRVLPRAELRHKENKNHKNAFYIVGADMAKDGAAETVVHVYKVIPGETTFQYRLANLIPIKNPNYEEVAKIIKKIIRDYDAKLFTYDATGVGASLRDHLNKADTYKGEYYPALGVINPPKETAKYYKKCDKAHTICYEIKASTNTNTAMHRYLFGKLSSGNLLLLQDTKTASLKYSKFKSFQKAPTAHKTALIKPHQLTDVFEEQMKNLQVVNTIDKENANVMRVIRRNVAIQKDHFSAAEFTLYGAHKHLELAYYKNKSRKGTKIGSFVSYTNSKTRR